MNGKRQTKDKILTRAARAVAIAGVILSLLSIQQVWAEEFCTCDHQNSSSSASERCTKHAAQHQHSEKAHCVAAEQQTTQADDCEEAHSLSSHQHAAQPAASEDAESVATAADTHDDSDHEQGFGASSTARVEVGVTALNLDGRSTSAKLDCCQIQPATNLPVAVLAVYGPDVATDSTPLVFDNAPARTFIPAILFHPPPSRHIYVTVSSFLI
jgi:hypothetical protein